MAPILKKEKIRKHGDTEIRHRLESTRLAHIGKAAPRSCGRGCGTAFGKQDRATMLAWQARNNGRTSAGCRPPPSAEPQAARAKCCWILASGLVTFVCGYWQERTIRVDGHVTGQSSRGITRARKAEGER